MDEPSVAQLISVDEALAILDGVDVVTRTSRKLLHACVGQRLAEDVRCDRPYPPFDKAVMDGYAVRAADADGNAPLRCAGTHAAGNARPLAVQNGEAIAIMTGAPLPTGADAVVPVEHTSRSGDRVTIHRSARAGQSIALAGSDRQADEVVARRGDAIGPAMVGALATVGCAFPLVFDRPRVVVLPTGDELIGIDQTPSGSTIRNSNAAMLSALLHALGCEVTELPPCRDDRPLLLKTINQSLTADALFVTGGMSMGERDFVPGIFDELGLVRKISKLRIKPGKPFVMATDGGRLAFGLPGNPVSAFLCTLRLASRVIDRMTGGTNRPLLPTAPLAEPVPANGPREFYQPGVLGQDGSVTPMPWRGSADLFTLASADVFIVRHENAPAAAAGSATPILRIPPARTFADLTTALTFESSSD